MARDSYRTHIEAVPLFAHCNSHQVDHVLKVADELNIPAGTAFIREGEVGREMFIIVDGTADVTRNGSPIAEIGRNDFVGELSVLRHAKRNATVTARTDLDVLVLTNNVIEPLLDDIPGLAKALLYDVVDRLNAEEERAAGAH
jgi:CRP/FNR family transcriptional regulator, cyclic AMP receptor protein